MEFSLVDLRAGSLLLFLAFLCGISAAAAGTGSQDAAPSTGSCIQFAMDASGSRLDLDLILLTPWCFLFAFGVALCACVSDVKLELNETQSASLLLATIVRSKSNIRSVASGELAGGIGGQSSVFSQVFGQVALYQ